MTTDPENGMRWWAIRAAFAATLIAMYLVLEFAAKLFIVHSLGIDRDTYADFYRSDPEYELVTWSDDHIAHPYFGYVRPDQLRELERILKERDRQEYVIAILGGSVAAGFASYVGDHPEHFAQSIAAIPAIGERRIRIVNLALGGYKQPQQFIMASYLLGHVDMMMNIDGFNEMAKEDLFPAYPTDFPATTLRLFIRQDGGAMDRYLDMTVTSAYRMLYWLPINLPPVASSNLYFLLWRTMHPRLFQGIKQLEQRYLAAIGASAASGRSEPPMASWQRKVEIWRKYTRLQHQVAQAADVPMYFFLQPNQYLRGSKPMSERERAIAINPGIAEARDAQMTLLRGAAAELRAEGVPMFDLTQIYRGTLEPVYRDACCHLVDLGNEIMAEQIVATIQRDALGNGRAPVRIGSNGRG